jgi:hypothetical protein
LHLILPPYYIKLCNECCTQQQPQLPHPCEEEIQISSFLSWNFQSTNQKKYRGATSNPKLPNTQKLLRFSNLLVSKAKPPKKNLIRNKTKDKSLQQVQQLDHLQQQQQQQQIKLLLLSFLSSAWFLKSNQKHTQKKKDKTCSYKYLQLQVDK